MKQLLARQVLAIFDDLRQAAVFDFDVVVLAALPAKVEEDFRTTDFRMAIFHGREAIGFIVARVFLVADADQTHFQKFDDGRKHFLAR